MTGSIPYDEYVDGLFTDNENKMAVIAHNSRGVGYTYLDFEKGECGDVTCYINDSAGLCAYNAKEQSITPLFGWTDTGIVGGFGALHGKR